MLSKKCLMCGDEFHKKINRSLKSWNEMNKYCSRQCSNKSKLGHIPWNKGTIGICIAWNKGLKFPENEGEGNNCWKGTDDKYWRIKCKERDNYTCTICGLRDVEIMEVDHIKQKSKFPELRFSLENLQTLCPNCHKRKTIKELKNKRI